MPRFHFHLKDGHDSPDEDGTDLGSVEHARAEALRFAGEMLATVSPADPFAREWQMQVTDNRGMTLFLLDFQMTDSPAVGRTG